MIVDRIKESISVKERILFDETIIIKIQEAGELIKAYNSDIYFHVDAVQGYGKFVIRPKSMKIDLLSVSGHKIHGPKGIGFLYIKKGTKINPICYGGGQQKGMRSGTENVPGIAGLALAAKMCYENFEDKFIALGGDIRRIEVVEEKYI